MKPYSNVRWMARGEQQESAGMGNSRKNRNPARVYRYAEESVLTVECNITRATVPDANGLSPTESVR